ncbi:XRE family transcriptional regulator [Streptococcus sp. X16XC17]|uniref:helix-turn-helix transcriptional regulator n=1 Tax=unclassified Streptococcus TaxID=2608887 RepID=UPI00066FB5DB|nr:MULTISPECIES: helix-turn-helix transcriptional regulator [unclassified Streptococcus]TCD46624.1 XRE family transcriptional regulator [Streptococcus sp. X16XC17]
MEIGKQIQFYRNQFQLSQEELAEKIYVTRQTISNRENNKTYPDVQSLLLLSHLFQIQLDNFIQGDIEEMKTIIQQEAQHQLNRHTYFMLTLMISSSISVFPLFYFLDWWGFLLWTLQLLPLFFFAHRIEVFKKKYDVQTYKELVAISEGRALGMIEKREEKAKYPYQKPLIVISFAIGAAILAIISSILVQWFFS